MRLTLATAHDVPQAVACHGSACPIRGHCESETRNRAGSAPIRVALELAMPAPLSRYGIETFARPKAWHMRGGQG